MRRVVITGLGIVSSIGNNKEEVVASLRDGRSGIEFSQEYADLGFRSQVHGTVKLDLDSVVDRKARRFMGDGAAYNFVAMEEAIADAGLTEAEVSNERTGLIMGSGGPSTQNQVRAADLLREKGSSRRVGPYMVPRTMSSTNSATLSTWFKIKGPSYSISSACSTSAHCIGNGAELIQWDKQDIVFAGGGVVVLEELEHARARGAKIYGELVGYGATSDGFDMVQPSGEGATRCMQQALSGIGNTPVEYVNTHGTSTPIGDVVELRALKEVFGDRLPKINSTKSLTGHALGAAGVNEAIYALLMMERGFISASANIEELDPEAEGMPVVREREDNVQLNCVISNSFGFGGTNCTLAFKRFES